MAIDTNVGAPATAYERLTWQEICARHPDEWVVLTELVWEDDDEDNGALVSAVVLGHSKEREQCLRETRARREREGVREFAHWFTGEIVRHPTSLA